MDFMTPIMPWFANRGIMGFLKSIMPRFLSKLWHYGFLYSHNATTGNFENMHTHIHKFLIAMDGSDWAIHDSYPGARWRRLANFNYFIHDSDPGS